MQAEHGALSESEFTALLDASTEAVLRVDRAGAVVRCNRAAQRILGRTDAELIGTSLSAALSSPEGAAFVDLFGRNEGAGPAVDGLQVTVCRTDDQLVPLALSVATAAADGVADGWWVLAHDLSEQHDWQRTLAESERRVRRSEVLAGTGSFVMDRDTSTAQWSAGLYEIFGVTPAQFEPSLATHLDLVHPEDRHAVAAAFAKALAGGDSIELDHRACPGDGREPWVLLAIEPTRAADGRVIGVSGVCQDISVRKQADLALREALNRERAAGEELRRLDKAKEEFLATVSHELRTPLTAILGFSSLLRSIAVEHEQLAAPIERNALDMHRMIERLLDYSRLEAGRVAIERRSIAVAEQVENACRQLEVVLAARLVEVDVPADLMVWADPDALQRILVNLLSNAAKYSVAPAVIRVTAEAGGQGTVVSVTDEGPGIDAEHQAQIFERFYRVPGATRAQRGTGVGLAIVAQYVELHGGSVWVDSVPGKGSSFRFDLATGGRG